MRGRHVLTVLAMSATVGLAFTSTAEASSHREAPFIAKNAKVDGTDFYMFNSYEAGRAGYVTILANYQPLQVPAGGPNFYAMDDDALYEIEIDNVGDGHEHLTFQFQFSDPLDTSGAFLALNVGPDGGVPVTVPFLNVGTLGSTAPGAFNTGTNRNEMYSVNVVTGDRRTGTSAPVTAAGGTSTSFQRPLDYIGATTFGNAASYETYSKAFIQNVTIPGCTPAGVAAGTTPRVWVGQRQEPFAVNLGVVFDLLDAPAIASVLAGGSTTGSDCGGGKTNGACPSANPIGGYNITTIALEVPASCLVGTSSTTIGGWTTSSVRQARVINPAGTYANPTKEGGAWAQVSRLGMPLVNELVIGLKDKDTWNASAPVNDVANFAPYVTNPTLPAVIAALYGPTVAAADAPTVFPRSDLLTAFLTGIPGVNQIRSGDAGAPVDAEMLRLNTALGAPVAASQSSLGALNCVVQGGGGALQLNNANCDPAGFPNGRRPGDDVVDVTLRVAEGYLLPSASAPGGAVPWSDAVEVDATKFQSVFPYFNTPNSGNPG